VILKDITIDNKAASGKELGQDADENGFCREDFLSVVAEHALPSLTKFPYISFYVEPLFSSSVDLFIAILEALSKLRIPLSSCWTAKEYLSIQHGHRRSRPRPQ
jgi:hypothetical protein